MELTDNSSYQESQNRLKNASLFDWIFALILAAGAVFALNRYGDFMDVYEKGILLASAPVEGIELDRQSDVGRESNL